MTNPPKSISTGTERSASDLGAAASQARWSFAKRQFARDSASADRREQSPLFFRVKSKRLLRDPCNPSGAAGGASSLQRGCSATLELKRMKLGRR
jgi:hypothetical protein